MQLENKLFAQTGSGEKIGAVEHAKKTVKRLEEEEPPNVGNNKQTKSIESRREKLKNAWESM